MSSFISFLVYSNIIASVVSSTITLLTFFLLNEPINLPILMVVFSGTLLIYTLNRFTDLREDAVNLPNRVEFIRKHGKVMLFIAAFLYIVSLIIIALHSSLAALVAIFPLVIAFSYSYFRLKRFFLVKNFLVSLGLICSVLIVGAYYHEFSISLLLLTVFIFIAMLVNTIVFDVKDIRGDALCNIRTFPVQYGLVNTKCCCYLLLLPLFLITVCLILWDLRSVILVPFLGYIASYTYFLKSPEQCPEWYFGLYVDGEYLFLLFCIVIFYLAGILTVR